MSNYIAINTKIKAMRKNLCLDRKDFEEDYSVSNLQELYRLIDQLPSYHAVLSRKGNHYQENPNSFINVLQQGLISDFLKIYRFADLTQRKALKLYGIRFEARFIARILRHLEKEKSVQLVVGPYTDYLEECRNFKIGQLLTATTIEGAIDSFSETDYRPFFEQFSEYFHANSYDHYIISTAFDQYCSLLVWKKARQAFSPKELNAFKKLYGIRMDLANIRTIYRLKFLYHADENYIRAQLFDPSHYLNESSLNTLLSSQDETSFMNHLNLLGFENLFTSDDALTRSERQHNYLANLQKRLSKALPHSILPLLTYLEEKEKEAHLFEQIMEEVAYKVDDPTYV